MTAATYLTTPVVLPAPVQGEFPAGVEQASVAPLMIYGTGAPTGTVSAPPGSLYTNTSDGSVYSKSSTGTSGWAAAGGGGSTPTLAKGGLITHSTVDAALTVGTNGYVLTADSAQALGIKWAAAAPAPLTTKGDIYGFAAAAARVPVGADLSVLMADSSNPNGVSWDPGTIYLKASVAQSTYAPKSNTVSGAGTALIDGGTRNIDSTANTIYMLHATGTISAYTLHLFSSGDGTISKFVCDQDITTLTLTLMDSGAVLVGPAITSLAAGVPHALMYDATNNQWVPIA